MTSSVKKINGYKIMMDSVLGQGSYGTVYKGEQNDTKLECAIKIVEKKRISSDPYLKSALDSEIQIMSKLKSENIVRFFDVLMSNHNYYIVQELCDSDLERLMISQQANKVDEHTAIKLLTEICNGFMTLVKEGVVHRDMKPANVLLSKGVVKIGDFGFAKANAHKKVKNESSVGTPMYMSLEVLKCRSYTSKCDIWSIGCIFYELLHGITPWTANSEYELIENLMTRPLSLNQNLQPNTKDFLSRALRIKEEDRICWNELFKHPIFNGFFDEFIKENREMENKYKKVMSDLRFKINSQNIDLEDLWANLGFKDSQDINFEQFQVFLDELNTDMDQWEQRYFFQNLDPKGTGFVSLMFLTKELKKYQISTTSRHKNAIPLGIRKTNSINEDVEDLENAQDKCGWDEQFEQKVRACFLKLHKIITNKAVTLYKTFMVYDKDNNGELTIDEFERIMKKIDPSFTLQEIKAVFKLIDSDNSQSIKFQELNSYYCKVNGQPVKLEPSMNKAKRGKENTS